MAEVVDDPHLRAAGIVVDTGSPDESYASTISNPINMAQAPKRSHGRAPEIGEHSQEILREHGFSEEQIVELEQRGVIGQHAE